MDKNVAMAAMQFMGRVALNGSEVPAFCNVMNALQKLIDEQEVDSVS